MSMLTILTDLLLAIVILLLLWRERTGPRSAASAGEPTLTLELAGARLVEVLHVPTQRRWDDDCHPPCSLAIDGSNDRLTISLGADGSTLTLRPTGSALAVVDIGQRVDPTSLPVAWLLRTSSVSEPSSRASGSAPSVV